ncbi:Oxysterol-binding protein [Pyrenophora tritici-repentis]|nr:Oxysterol-binding protein [Pyrenophora tritici-repentis]KAF7442422.1 Oxysterol-binding protein [Pyrenophora tritici-repentis]KAF7579201.1 Oxysterol-BP domain containing protein [Pyrenophora tritici-repentis]KAG9378134.1 Oxysterol-binding protein [Pyrenophora tritici-repentis]KAI0586087.1 Oxysterol-binding protein [Pyrenophora tritici-repentis]
MSNDIASNRSGLKEFIGSIATISGDLSNITVPPFVLAENSTVEIPQYWADHPYLWASPASEENPEKRALLVLKNFLGSLRGQQYAGRDEADGVKKPLNAFLGEMFLGSWNSEELGETRLISEQVGHHPPVTACYLWNNKMGIRAEGFTQQEITFSGSVSIKQKGYAIVHVDKYDEDYLLPLPNIKVKGLLGGTPHPELDGEYSLISSNGYISHIKFEGKSLFGSGHKNSFRARFFHADHPDDTIYTIEGAWNSTFTIKDARSGTDIETFDVRAIKQERMIVPPLSEQDPWESRKAWNGVISALRSSNMKGVSTAKNALENGQRQMRKDEEARGATFSPIFFTRVDRDQVFDKLVQHDPIGYTVDPEGGIWKVDRDAAEHKTRPFHAGLTPANEKTGISNGDSQCDRREQNANSQHRGAAHTAGTHSPNGHVPNGGPVQQIPEINQPHERNPENSALQRTKPAPGTQEVNAFEPSNEQIENFLRSRTGNVG